LAASHNVSELARSRRTFAAGFVAVLFVLAQILFAAHSEDFVAHAPQSCEYCLAAAVADDPNDLTIEITAPAISFLPFERMTIAVALVDLTPNSASPRGPPSI